nr:unnamed protein product [Callosobruchus chinensis]
MYKGSSLVGPDLMSIGNRNTQNYMAQYLVEAGQILNATTWHSYYVDGTTATPNDFVNPNILDQLQNEVDIVKRIAGQYDLPIWLGETSSAYKGGAPNLSDHFTGSFCWIDKLGLLARENVQVVVRHSIFYEKDHYTFLDGKYDPNPDWWCARDPSSLVVFGSNLNTTEHQVVIAGLENVKQIEAYILTSANGTSLEDTVTKSLRLNGKLLELGGDGSLPAIEAEILRILAVTLCVYAVLSHPIENVNEQPGSNGLQQESEDMSTADTMAFRPLFAYRKKMEQRYKIQRKRDYNDQYPRGRWVYVYT